MIAGARMHRDDRPIVAVSLRRDGVGVIADWVTHAYAHHRAGTLRGTDVGPPVPHFHLDEHGNRVEHVH